MKLQKSKELQKLKEYYHAQYVEIWWTTLVEFAILFGILEVILILYVQKDTAEKSSIIFPLLGMNILLIANQMILKDKKLTEYALLFLISVSGIIITYEGLQYKEYRFHEVWLAFYSVFLVLSIAACFKWKVIIVIFFIIQTYQIISLHIKYSNISFSLYVGFIITTLLIPLIWMVNYLWYF